MKLMDGSESQGAVTAREELFAGCWGGMDERIQVRVSSVFFFPLPLSAVGGWIWFLARSGREVVMGTVGCRTEKGGWLTKPSRGFYGAQIKPPSTK